MKIHLAPMEGVVDEPLRSVYSKIGGFDHFVTEFVRVTERVLPPHVFYKYCPELRNSGRTAEGLPVFVQLLGGNPSVIADNAAAVCELGALGIDLNFGCPAKTVNRHDGGATLLKNPQRLYDVVQAVRHQVKVPVTAKVRLGFDDKSLCTDIAQAVDTAGAASLTIHARTRAEGYKPPAHWEFIALMKNSVSQVPIVANGDIWTVEDYLRCRSITGCDDVALGRPAIATPDLALQIKWQCAGLKNSSPMSWQEILEKWIPLFYQVSHHKKGQHFASSRLKQWSKQLGRSYPEAIEFFDSIKRLDITFADIENSMKSSSTVDSPLLATPSLNEKIKSPDVTISHSLH